MSEHIFNLKTLEDCLKNVPKEDLADLKTHIYGRANDNEIKTSPKAEKIATENNFVIKSYKFDAIKEDLRKPRIVRVASIQTSLAAPTSDPVSVQRQKIFDKVEKIIDAAAFENVNILCLQELWCELII
jgi:beta-ureidopropionase